MVIGDRKTVLLEKAIVDAKIEYKKIAEDVFLIENFISPDEQLKLVNFANSADWGKKGRQELEEIAFSKFGTKNIDKLLAMGKIHKQPMFDKIAAIPEESFLSIKIFERMGPLAPEGCLAQSFVNMQRHTDGSGLHAHIDKAEGVDIRYGAIVYVQQAEKGGEIYFHPLDLSVMPPERSLLLFRSDYLHEVLPVSGKKPRYALPSYFYSIY
jgi:Rps23 Pro-64 3,4-dihydroxylase Tpa1-like proline 4-hydroxylase